MQGVEEVLDGISRIAMSSRYKRRLGIGEVRPVSWLELEEKAKGLRYTVVVPIISWTEWIRMATIECKFQSEEAIKQATLFLHDMGSVIYFDSAQSKLNDT